MVSVGICRGYYFGKQDTCKGQQVSCCGHVGPQSVVTETYIILWRSSGSGDCMIYVEACILCAILQNSATKHTETPPMHTSNINMCLHQWQFLLAQGQKRYSNTSVLPIIEKWRWHQYGDLIRQLRKASRTRRHHVWFCCWYYLVTF